MPDGPAGYYIDPHGKMILTMTCSDCNEKKLAEQMAALTPARALALRDNLLIIYGNPLAPEPGGVIHYRRKV